MKDGRLMVWDIDRAFGQDVTRLSTAERERATAELFSSLNPKLNWHRCPIVSGAEGIEAALANGEEGTVGVSWDAPFNAIRYRVKRFIVLDCKVLFKHRNALALALNGEPVGSCPCRGANYEAINGGDIVEVIAYGKTVNGKLREARLKLDELGRAIVRRDKMAVTVPVRPNNISGESISFTISL
jgi:hypothetical protein